MPANAALRLEDLTPPTQVTPAPPRPRPKLVKPEEKKFPPAGLIYVGYIPPKNPYKSDLL